MRYVVELVLREQLLDIWYVLRCNVCDEEMLVGGEAERALVNLGDLAEAGFEIPLGLVLDATILNETGKVVFTVVALDPAVVVGVTLECVWPSRCELIPKELLNFRFEGVKTHAVYGVLKTSVLGNMMSTAAITAKRRAKVPYD